MKHLKKLLVIGASTSLMAFAACEPAPGPDDPPDIAVSNGGNSNTSALSLEGTFGRVAVDAQHQVRQDVFFDDFGTFISLTAPRAQGGAVMGMLFIEGVDLRSLEPGTTIRSDYETYSVQMESPDGEITEVDGFVDGIGCSGPTEGNWEDDEPAEDVEITIDENAEGDVVVEFENDFEDGDNLSGAIVL